MGVAHAQQDEVLDVIRGAGRPLSADEVRQLLVRETGIGLATVYRAVKRGVTNGQLQTVQVQDGPARYEPVDLDHHHHFACEECRSVYCIKGCPRGVDELAPKGFVLHSHDIVLHGLCKNCREGAAA